MRFYIADLLPESVEKILWLDHDIIVRCDVVQLIRTAFRDDESSYGVAAIRRPTPAYTFLDFSKLEDPMLDLGIDRAQMNLSVLKSLKYSFNAGVMLFNLRVWRAEHTRRKIETLVGQLIKHRISSYKGISIHDGKLTTDSSQTPLMLLFGTTFRELDPRWNLDGLGWRRNIAHRRVENACALHWSGAHKPWRQNNDDRWYDKYWRTVAGS